MCGYEWVMGDDCHIECACAVSKFSSDPAKANEGTFTKTLYGANSKELSLLMLDDPDHARQRRLVLKAFNKRAVDALLPRIEAIAATRGDGGLPALQEIQGATQEEHDEEEQSLCAVAQRHVRNGGVSNDKCRV